MTTLYTLAAGFDALTPDEWAATVTEAAIPVRLGEPARLRGTFDVDGMFAPDDTGPEWCAWDDPRLTESHAITLAVALED